jgi:hypothetical protein
MAPEWISASRNDVGCGSFPQLAANEKKKIVFADKEFFFFGTE